MAGNAVSLTNYRRLYSLVVAVAAIIIVILAASTLARARGVETVDFIQPLAQHIRPILSEDDGFTSGTDNDPADFAARLAAHDRPLELLRYCNRPSTRQFDNAANFLVSINGPEGTVARMHFGLAAYSRYNPNLLPYPVGSKPAYIGFARQSPNNVVFHHEIVYCDMDWSETRAIGRRILQCVEPASARRLLLPEASSPTGLCLSHKFLEMEQGHTDPRVFFSPLGEPLMVVGTNGRTNCMGQYVVDLRTVIPRLSQKMNLTNIPVRYSNLTELRRDDMREIEKNWLLLYDENNEEYVHHDITPRYISKGVNGSNILPVPAQELPQCMRSPLRDFSKTEDAVNEYHQATNSLRVTMCEFPCVPTIHNTVLVSLMHIKYKNVYELFYRRYAIIMNATAPFEIIGRTNNLMFAGLDEQTMLYTVSMVWDKSSNARPEWNDATGNSVIQANDSEYAEDSSRTKDYGKSWNELADGYYHRWIDDTVMINVGVNDCDAAVLHVPMRDVLDCIVVCE
ncbi:uncharacterized protein V1513DRAFT_447042 [Lipomyces chichibuensis]|uniref:uncharacterized protein n=1 Tax=Lipomyces chichibuensis TaxID=1546026 RepID=UPI00334365FF